MSKEKSREKEPKKFTEVEIQSLKGITDEVFVISNKPQLPIVQKMKSISCDIMNTGIRKVPMDYYFCKVCDKEHKFPICKTCAERCHKDHLILDYVLANAEHPALCMCGFKCHNMSKQKKEEVDFSEQNSIKCYFNQLSLNAGIYDYYIGINGRKVCTFCYHFCCHSLLTNEDDDESRKKAFKKYQFKKISVSREEFITGLEMGQIQCECLSLLDSKHKSSDYLFVFLNNLNRPQKMQTGEDEDDYFGNLQPTKILNLFFNCIELFESVYSGFIAEYNEFSDGLGQKNDNINISTIFGVGYANFASNSNFCNYNFYFNERINVYFTTSMAKILFEKNLKLNDQNNTFLINFIRGYTKFRLGSHLESVPRYLLTDLFNINPLHRKIWKDKCENIYMSSGLMKENLIHTINNMIERLIRQRPDLSQNIQVFIELYRIIKVFSRFFFMTKEEIIETCKIMDDFFAYISEFYSNDETTEIILKEGRVKLFKTVVKIITYFSIYINDETFNMFFNVYNPREEIRDNNERIYFHCFSEASKLTNKILVHLADGVRKEYEIATKLIEKKKKEKSEEEAPKQEGQNQVEEDEEELTYEEFQVALMQILYIIQLNFDFALQKNDHYLPSLKRSLNKYLPLFMSVIKDKDEDDNYVKNFGKTICEFTEHLEQYYYDYFNSPHMTLDLIQEYLLNVTNNILYKFEGNFENLIDKQNNIFTCEFAGVFKPSVSKQEWKMTYEFMINKSPSAIFSITKIFKLSKDKSVYSDDICRNVLKICAAYINDNPDNCLIGLSTPVLKNLSKIPRPYLCCVLDYMIFGLQTLIKNNTELSFGFFLAKFGFLIYHKTTDESKANNGKNLPNIFYCLVRLLKLLELIFNLKIADQNQFLEFMKQNLEEFIDEDLIQCYKLYLLNIAKDFQKRRKYYTSKRIFDNPDLFCFQFRDYIQLSNTFNSSLMFTIFYRLMKLVTKTFDAGALSTIPAFLKDFLSQKEISEILTITSLDVGLRIELIKYFRMIYIDLSINSGKMEQYRYEFRQELDTELQEISDGLLSIDSMKVFLFLQRLLKISNYNYTSEDSKSEFKLVFFEVKNFKKIIMNAKHCEKSVYMSYIENGIILPVKVYLNKVLSTLMTIRGEGLLQLYRFCYYVLKMKEFIIESNLIANSTEEDKAGILFKNEKFTNEDALNDVKYDIELITDTHFPVLNYREIYLLINKHVMSLIDEPTSNELVLYLSEYAKYEAKEKHTLRIKLEKEGVDFSMECFNQAWDAYEHYVDQKNNLDKSSLKANFDDTFINGEITVRIVVMDYLFFLATNKANCFEEEGINMLLKLLKFEPNESQNAIFSQSNKEDINGVDVMKRQKTVGPKNKLTTENNVDNKTKSIKQINDFYYMAKSCFDNLLSSIFSQYNPTSLELSDEYYYCCHIIKVFKYLCEAHNQQFQKRLMNDISFSIGKGEKLCFYDMMVFVLDKILIISSWENSKSEEEIQDYFYGLFSCVVELLIEIVRGADPKNFKTFLNDDIIDTKDPTGLSPTISLKESNNQQRRSSVRKTSGKNLSNEKVKYVKGGALKILLQNIKGIMFEGTTESETIFSVRTILMQFILSFMEEVNCPRRIQNIIMSYYHPSIVIKSISDVLKIYYIKKLSGQAKINANDETKRNRINQIVDQNIAVHNENTINKLLKYVKFNKELCDTFIQLYFDDPEFAHTKYFGICNAYYKYFLLTYIQFKNEETIDYWNRIHNKGDLTLDAYNKRTKVNLMHLGQINVNDESDFEAYYIIKLFSEIDKYVLVKTKPTERPIYVIYTIHPYARYLTSDTKDEFLRNVDRKNRYTKLYDLIENSQYFQLEIIYNWNYLRKSALLRFSTNINYHFLGYLTFAASFAINMTLLITLRESGNEYYGYKTLPIIKIICFIVSGFEIIIIIFWFLTKFNLYYQIEMAKFKERNRDRDNVKNSNLLFSDKLNICWQAIFGKGELNPFLIFTVTTLIGAIFTKLQFLISFGLLCILSLNQNLSNIGLSILYKGNSLMWTSLFTFVLLFEYAGWGFYYQRDRYYEESGRDKPESMCSSLLYCFLTMINNGMRWHAGVGKIVRSESGILHFWDFVHRFVYDLLFFWLIEAMMLKIVYGIILDSFGELRQAHYLIEKDIANNCFICHIEKDECEKNNISFTEHCEKLHYIWDYIFYMITLRMEDNTQLSAVDAANKAKILKKNVDWMPDSAIDKLEDNEEE